MAMAMLVVFSKQSCKIKPKDADLQQMATEAVAKVPDAGPTPMISVQNGVATLTGEVKDGVVTLTGTLKKSDLQKVMMTLAALKPKKIENKLTIQ